MRCFSFHLPRLEMGQKHAKHKTQVWPREGDVTTSEAWDQTNKNSLAEVVAEYGLQVPYDPSVTSHYWRSCQDQNIIKKNDRQEMTYSLPAEIRTGGVSICNAVRENILRLQSSLRHVTFAREDNRKPSRALTEGINKRQLSVEHLESLQVRVCRAENVKKCNTRRVSNFTILVRKDSSRNPRCSSPSKVLDIIHLSRRSGYCWQRSDEMFC